MSTSYVAYKCINYIKPFYKINKNIKRHFYFSFFSGLKEDENL